MNNKKDEFRFTIRLSRTEPSHLQVVDILNQKRYGKAQYIVDAVIHYIGCGLTESAAQPEQIDEKYIETIVNRILLDRDENVKRNLPAPANENEMSLLSQHNDSDNIEFSETMDVFGEKGIKAVADALTSFRRK